MNVVGSFFTDTVSEISNTRALHFSCNNFIIYTNFCNFNIWYCSSTEEFYIPTRLCKKISSFSKLNLRILFFSTFTVVKK